MDIIYFSPDQPSLMRIICEECGSEDWKIKIHDARKSRGFGEQIYSALQCENCGMVYPLCTVVRTSQRDIDASVVRDYLKETIDG